MKKEEKKVSLETMTGVGKKKKIAGREYLILPVNIMDMKYIMGDENPEEKLIILDRKQLEKEDDVNWQLFGLNITDSKRKASFMYIINKYVYYCVNDEKIPMTEELLIEHNWSFKEIGDFLFNWCQISD
jgi:hypothetical protein